MDCPRLTLSEFASCKDCTVSLGCGTAQNGPVTVTLERKKQFRKACTSCHVLLFMVLKSDCNDTVTWAWSLTAIWRPVHLSADVLRT